MDQIHGDRVDGTGTTKHTDFDPADFASRVWESAATSLGRLADKIASQPKADKSVESGDPLPKLEISKPKTNNWTPVEKAEGSSGKVDELSNRASITVDAKEFFARNPELKEKLPNDPLGKSGFKARHATTGEVDAGWRIDEQNKDGSLRLSKEYKLEVKSKGNHDGLVEAIPGVPDAHIKSIEAKIAQLPENVQRALKDAGYKIVATRFNTDAIPELKGLHPRGWDPKSNFDTSDGTHDNVRRLILAPYAFVSEGAPTEVMRPEVVVHQIGHALDHAKGKLSNDPDFQEAFKKDMLAMGKKELNDREQAIFDYFSQQRGPARGENPGSEECFASLFGLVLTGPENPQDRKPFEDNFKNTIDVIRKQIKGL